MKIIYVLLFFIFGCSIDPPIKYYGVFIESSFTTTQKIEILSAIYLWNISFNNQIDLEILDTNFNSSNLDILYNQNSIVILSKFVKDDNPALGTARKKHGAGFIHLHINIINYYEYSMEYITLHELGHVFGAKHTNHGLMSPVYSGENYSCIDKLTTEQVEKAMGLEQHSMLYCEN